MWKQTLILLALLLSWPAAAKAQNELQWREQNTTYLAILYPDGYADEAAQYAAFADTIYEEVTTILGYRPDPPLTLRIYPTMEVYAQVNPLVRTLGGVIAHAHTGRREISIALPLLRNATEEDIRNVVRHELVHIIAAELSQGELSVMWQEGIAQYVERPAPIVDQKLIFLRGLYDYDRLLSWNELNAPGVMYGNPDLGYPQSWSMVAFLVEQYGMPAFIDFLQANATSNGYRAALQQVYGRSSSELEAEWQAQLGSWLARGSTAPIESGVNIASLQAAIDAGLYNDAVAQAEAMLPTISDATTKNQVEVLLGQARRGVRAEQAANNTRTALANGDYAAAAQHLNDAQRFFAQLGRNDVTPVLTAYAEHLAQGQQAYTLLEQAKTSIARLRWISARQTLDQAALMFGQLGDPQGQQAAQQVLQTLNQRIRLLGFGVLVIVLLGLAWNIDRRRAAHKRALPLG